MELEDLVCPLDASESSAGERLSTVSDVSPTNNLTPPVSVH